MPLINILERPARSDLYGNNQSTIPLSVWIVILRRADNREWVPAGVMLPFPCGANRERLRRLMRTADQQQAYRELKAAGAYTAYKIVRFWR
ncbi:hypothetical protein [Pararhizobium sp.]|uniref:hypothetical protein n=1 Tax=Pararhizobium sp. TaxID=1977563 RepID=UPI003D0C5FC7